MNKQKIKEFMSAFGECSHEERAKILVEAAKAQRRAINSAICGAQSRDLEIRTNELTIGELKEKIQDWSKSYGQLYKEREEMRQRLQSENDFLTLKVAELEMKLRGNNRVLDANKRGVASWNDSETAKERVSLFIPTDDPQNPKVYINDTPYNLSGITTIADVNLPNSGSSATVLNDDAFEKLKSEMNGREFVSNVNEKGYLTFTPKSEPEPEDPNDPEQKPIIEQIEGVLEDLTVLHNGYLGDVNNSYINGDLQKSEYEAYISASEAEFNTAKSLIKKLLLNTQIIYKKVSKSPYAYAEKLKSE